jgi:hypothetical protein
MPGGSSRAINGVIYMRDTALYRSQCHTYRNTVKIYKHYIFCFTLGSQDDPWLLLKPEEYDIFMNKELMNFDKSG